MWVVKENVCMGYKRVRQCGLQKGTSMWVIKGYASVGCKRKRLYGL